MTSKCRPFSARYSAKDFPIPDVDPNRILSLNSLNKLGVSISLQYM